MTTKANIALAELAEKGAEPDLLREMIQYVAQRMMEMDAAQPVEDDASNQPAITAAVDRYPVKRSPRVNNAHIVRAFLFATATAATFTGRRRKSSSSHGRLSFGRARCHLMTD